MFQMEQQVLKKGVFQVMFNDLQKEQRERGHLTTDEINKTKVASENNHKVLQEIKNKHDSYYTVVMSLSKERLTK